jgi:hypothetical protein
VDVYLPPGASGTVSAILIFTPYYRRFATIWLPTAAVAIEFRCGAPR